MTKKESKGQSSGWWRISSPGLEFDQEDIKTYFLTVRQRLVTTIREGIFRPKDKAGNFIEYNRMYYRVIYLQEDLAKADRQPNSFLKIIVCY